MDNLEEQQHQEGITGTTILKDLYLEGQKEKAKTQSKKLKKPKGTWKFFRRILNFKYQKCELGVKEHNWEE